MELFLVLLLSVSQFNKDISGSWTNPASGNVVIYHNVKEKTINVKWKYDSDGTGQVLFRGAGTIEALNFHEAKINVPFQQISLIIDGKVCPTQSIIFSSIMRVTASGMLARQCNLTFAFQCPHDIVRQTRSNCDGRWE